MNWTHFDKPTNNLYPPMGGMSVDTPLRKFFLREENSPVYTEQVTIERLDDIPLLWALQQLCLCVGVLNASISSSFDEHNAQSIALGDILDAVIPRHWFHQGLSIGQLVSVWNTFILSQGDHRKVTVRDWVAQHQTALEELLGEKIRDTDFTDDRLGQVLTHLSSELAKNHEAWQAIEDQLWHNSVQVYFLLPQRVRLDATTAKGYHTVQEETLMQFGYSPAQPHQPQVKVMVASVDSGTNGHLVAIEVAKGQSADDPLYQPVLVRLRHILQQAGLLYLGDSKMSALATRADIVAHGDFYLVPLARFVRCAR